MKHFKFSYILIALAAIAQGVIWINVFKLLLGGIWIYIGGIPAGIAIVGLTVKSANLLPRVQSKRARETGWGLLFLLMVVEPLVLGNANYIEMSVKSYIIAYGASFAISLVLVLGALVDRSLVPAEKHIEPKVKQKKQTEKQEQKQPEQIASAFTCSVCNYPAISQKALNGHMKKHKPKAYAVHFEPITDGEKKVER
jgi:hypothetical protein